MLLEISVQNLGVIDQMSIELPKGLIALTGETGAGKTLLVDAISLLVGERADPKMVRTGASEAVVDGRFVLDGNENIISRVVASEGRSKAYINNRPSTVGACSELGSKLVDLHGQHEHQSLLGTAAQRESLDIYGKIDLSELNRIKVELAEIDEKLSSMGGDVRSRARELDLVRYQVNELNDAELSDPLEDEQLQKAENLLANAVTNRELIAKTLDGIITDSGGRDALAVALKKFEGNPLFDELLPRIATVVAELDEIADDLRSIEDQIEQDPAQLDSVQQRRALLTQLRKKYGDDLSEVIAERDSLTMRLKELEDFDVLAAELDDRRIASLLKLGEEQKVVKQARADAAPKLAAAIESKLPDLAMAKAKVGISVDGDDGSEVSFLLAANPGSPMLPLAKVASGGELARTMLALRSVLSEAPPVLVFDEVDAGIGGQAGFSVGRSLADLGDKHQVLVVTHLPQVAAFADAHLLVEKRQGDDDTVSNIRLLNEEERVNEIARMLSGHPDSQTARTHAEELIASAQKTRK